MKPSDFTIFPMGSIEQKCESEVVAQNIMIILTQNGNKFRKLGWKEYKRERLKDRDDFYDGEKPFFNTVVSHCTSASKAKLFSKAWNINSKK